MAWDALGVSWEGLTTFASGLYHAMRGRGARGKRKERMFQSRANKDKASDERKNQIA